MISNYRRAQKHAREDLYAPEQYINECLNERCIQLNEYGYDDLFMLE